MVANPVESLIDMEDPDNQALELAIFTDGSTFYLEVDSSFPQEKNMLFDWWLETKKRGLDFPYEKS